METRTSGLTFWPGSVQVLEITTFGLPHIPKNLLLSIINETLSHRSNATNDFYYFTNNDYACWPKLHK